jgi:FkbM family methyltransferase
MHYAFEPVPQLYSILKRKYTSAVNIFPVALSNKKGKQLFTVTAPDAAYSGFKDRPLLKHFKRQFIEVDTDRLDNVLSTDVEINLIKIDVEGAEYWVLEGAEKIIRKWKPYILFEFGKGGADIYNITPEAMYNLLEGADLKINLLPDFLKDRDALTLSQFIKEYETGKEYFFIAYSKNDDVK